MKITSSFSVQAPPDRVYRYLLDINRVVSCVPGAQLSEVVDSDTFRGTVRIAVGPITISYQGIARFTARDPETRTAIIEAEGKETSGSGSARATVTISVREDGSRSTVTFLMDLNVGGRVARFGRGLLEDVARHIATQVGKCIEAKLDVEGGSADLADPGAASGAERYPAEAPSAAPGVAAPGGHLGEGQRPPDEGRPGLHSGGGQARSAPPAVEDATPPASIDALALARMVAGERLRRLGRHPLPLAVLGVTLAVIIMGAILLLGQH